MRGKNTLVINGKVYDAVTGLPVAAPSTVKPDTAPVSTAQVTTPQLSVVKPSIKHRQAHHAGRAHTTTQKSSTLRRDVLKKPVSKVHTETRRKLTPGHVARSDAIARFAPHPQPLKTTVKRPNTGIQLDIKPVKKPATHSIVAQKHALVTKKPELAKSSQPALSSRALKEQLISERLAQVDTSSAAAKPPKAKSRLFSKQPRAVNLVMASLAVMILGGYLTYLNMPGLSVRVAAAQADVAASFPDYHPDGYRFNGPVAYAPGQVAIDFAANGGTTKYTVTEQKSSWDSQAVYDNIVAKAADGSYITNSQQGLTIYTFKGEAAWVNKGILYTIHGDAPLNNEQLLRIAGSL
jgi:hypothetical protein